MSFFKDIKDELEQAVNDIDTTEPQETEEDLFALASEDAEAEMDEELLADMLEDEEDAADEPVAEAAPVKAPEAPEASETLLKEEKSAQKERVEDKSSVTVITKGTTINGSIISDCSLDVMGTINGDIECLGKLTISGKVTGNSMASEVFVNTDRLEGSINSEGSVKIGLGTVIIGDISASSAVFAGAVKGEIDVKGPVILDSTAIIKGNIKAKSVQMNNGAIMEGFCSLSYADLEIDEIFE